MAEEDTPKVKILSLRATDDSLKKFGEVISNSTGRKILLALTEKEGYLNEIAQKIGITVPTLLNHMEKLQDIGLLTTSCKPISRKTKEHNYYILTPDVFVSLTPLTPEEEQSKLKRIFKEGVKFASIGIASVVSFFIASDSNFKPSSLSSFNDQVTDNHLFPIVIFLGVLIVGLILERIHTQIKKK